MSELREGFQKFFEARGHARMPAISLVPEGDATVLFTSAGMQRLSNCFEGVPHPLGSRLVGVQKCLRMDDIEEVGGSAKLTFFEMLGNWSLGDYFKQEALTWSYQFLTEFLRVSPTRLAVTVFEGDDRSGPDEESARVWRELGLPPAQIYRGSRKTNWWGPVGISKYCGADSKIFFDSGKPDHAECGPHCPCGKWLELWDNVFIEYRVAADGHFDKLSRPSVDTGMGLERAVMVLTGASDVYRIDTLAPLIEGLERLCGRLYDDNPRPFRIVADHLRAATFAISDGVVPSNVGAGNVVRRLIRRSILSSREISLPEKFCSGLAAIVVDIFGNAYPELRQNSSTISFELEQEEDRFRGALDRGIQHAKKMISKIRFASRQEMDAAEAFALYASFGIPLNLTVELARQSGIYVDRDGFGMLLEEHRLTSRKGMEQRFRAGQEEKPK